MEKVSHPWRDLLIIIVTTWLFSWIFMEKHGAYDWAEALGMALGPIGFGIVLRFMARGSARPLVPGLLGALAAAALIAYGGTIS